MANLDEFIELYGKADLLRVAEIKAPKDYDSFINRLYIEIGDVISGMESARKERTEDGEDRISVEIVQNMKARGYIAFKDPTHGGHVDIFVQPERKQEFTWFAEAKIWRGSIKLKGGLEQLLNRYASGRQKNIGLLVYFKCPELTIKLNEWRSFISDNGLCQFKNNNLINDFSFETTHKQQAGTEVVVRHMGINLCWSP